MRNRNSSDRHIARRNLIAGIVAGAIVAMVAGVYAKTTFKKMVKGAPATAADVNAAHQDLADAIDKLQAEISKLKNEPICPPGYTLDTTATTITLCKKGADQMVKVGSFWVDRYEVSIVDASVFAGGYCSGTGKQYGTGASDDYPNTPGKGFPDSGDASVPLYSCSIKGNMPSVNITWFQAALACELSGKQLCTNYQWQVAALGTPDDSTSCNVSTKAKEAAGKRSKCVSRWGAQDMVGNVWEWVAWWSVAGRGWMTSDGEMATPRPTSKGYGDGQDKTWNLDGTAHNGLSWTKGLPAAARRGGSWNTGASAGVFAVFLNYGPSSWNIYYGARCCRE